MHENDAIQKLVSAESPLPEGDELEAIRSLAGAQTGESDVTDLGHGSDRVILLLEGDWTVETRFLLSAKASLSTSGSRPENSGSNGGRLHLSQELGKWTVSKLMVDIKLGRKMELRYHNRGLYFTIILDIVS